MGHHHTTRPWALLLLLPILLPACAERGEEDIEAESEQQGVSLDTVYYDLDWDMGEARELEGGGWAVTTDLGYEVEVTRGYLVNYRLSLVPCEQESAAAVTPGVAGVVVAALDLVMGASEAKAGHGDELDDSTTELSQAEELDRPGEMSMGHRHFAPERYCKVHYLVARALPQTENMPFEMDLEGASLYLEGSWRRGDGPAQPFALRSDLANGMLADIELPAEGDAGLGSMRVTVVRRLDRWLDGVDFEVMDEATLARALLRNLMRSSEIHFTFGLWPDDDPTR